MNLRIPTILFPALALLSCDKARDIASKATTAVKHRIVASAEGEGAVKMDDTLRELVDQTADGVVFRKDLQFPKNLEVRTTQRREISGRFYQASAIERHAETVNGTQLTITQLERADGLVRYTPVRSGFSVPSADDPEGEPQNIANPLEQAGPAARPVTFRKTGEVWASDERDGFRAAVLSKQLTPVLDELLIENALSARTLWFTKRRLKIGDELDVTGDNLPMLLAGDGKGSFHLKFEAIEGVYGHPCGVFSVTGAYHRKEFPDFIGNLTDEDVSIQSGKFWLSLLYPVILKEDLDTIQTFKSGGHGGLSGRGQGRVKVSLTREWKAVAP